MKNIPKITTQIILWEMSNKFTFTLFKKYWNNPKRDLEIEDYLLTSNELFLNYILSENKLPEFLHDLNNK